MLLASSRCEKHLPHFLELSGVMENGKDIGGVRTARLDGWIVWIVWEHRDRARTSLSLSGSRKGRVGLFRLFLYFLTRLLRGSHTPSFAHSAPVRAEDSLGTHGGG
jgi:hypothetical protein